ncbi:hypothetical protein [Pyrococcus kukulkanii]|uniref:hypothetical protein n=1 Tax=Pyrococcus kukulkanii TaxID=1609559 RepID=UPI00356B35B2
MPRRKYQAMRRVEFILPPEKVEELEKAKKEMNLSWGDFVWKLWLHYKTTVLKV